MQVNTLTARYCGLCPVRIQEALFIGRSLERCQKFQEFVDKIQKQGYNVPELFTDEPSAVHTLQERNKATMPYEQYHTCRDQVLVLLEKNKVEWKKRYLDYASIITENLESIKSNRRRLRESAQLKFYLNTTNAKKAKNTVCFDMRYLGQRVAEVTSSIDGITLSTKGFEDNNQRDFGCEIKLDNVPWGEKEARAFRAYLKNREPLRNKAGNNKGNDEHRLESLLLSEFSKKSGNKKALKYIQPVMIGGFRFPMPTPISANKKELMYSGQSGGGIDILARVGIGNHTRLCVIELKDENKPSEPASDVLKQAIKYAVFIRELLRSKAGMQWWELFGFGGGEIPKKLVIHAVCAMLYIENADTSFCGHTIGMGGDEIQLQYIYFKEANNKIKGIETSLGKQAEKSE